MESMRGCWEAQEKDGRVGLWSVSQPLFAKIGLLNRIERSAGWLVD